MNKIGIIFKNSRYFYKYIQSKKINIDIIGKNMAVINKEDLNKIPKYYIVSTFEIGLNKIPLFVKENLFFIITILIGLLIMVIASHMVFKIEILHDDPVIRKIIKEELDYYNIKVLTFKKDKKKLNYIKKQIKKDNSSHIEWLEIIEDGMKYTVKVEERIITKEKKTKKYCDIISTKSAVISNVKTIHGDSVLTIDDYVNKGDVIISGEIKQGEEIKNYVCAEGLVYGKTWYKINVNLPLYYTNKKYTGRKKYNIAIKTNSFTKELLNNHFDNYDISNKKLFAIGKYNIVLETIYEYEPIKKKYSEKEALMVTKKLAKEKLKILLSESGKIIDEKILQYSSYNSIMYIEFFYSTDEIISKQVAREIPTEGDKKDDVTE